MTTEEVSRLLKGRREGKNYRAKCPVHGSRGPSLGIYSKREYTKLTCYAGCDIRDILASIGLRMGDLYYVPRDTSPEALKAYRKAQDAARMAEQQKRREELSMVEKAINRPRRPVTLTDCAHATMEHRMECYFAQLGV